MYIYHLLTGKNMQTYIAILRGINVSGHRIIKMDALRQLFAGLGFSNSRTYIQSGNVVFQCKGMDTEKMAIKIAKAITAGFSFDVPVIVKEYGDLVQVAGANPFLADKTKDIAHLHVTFLSDKPEAGNIHSIAGGQYLPDEFLVMDKAVYLYCPNGYSNSKLTNSFFENKLKVTATTRNWKTVNELVKMAQSG
jgi:uncharacterized protein (DUF1697 family)